MEQNARLRVVNGKWKLRRHKRFLPVGKEFFRARCLNRSATAILVEHWEEVDCAICLKRKGLGYVHWR